VSVTKTSFVKLRNVRLVVLNITGTEHVGSKMPGARRGMVDQFVVASVVEGNLPAMHAGQ